MSLEYQQIIYQGDRVARAVTSLLFMRAETGGTIDRIDIYAAISLQSAIFNVRVNGVAQFSGGSRPTITVGNTHVAVTGLSISISRGDSITLDVESPPSGGIAAPIVFIIRTDDGLAAASSMFNPDLPPTSPHADNDEFTGASLDPSWTIYGPSDVTITIENKMVKLTRLSNSNGFSGIGKALPSGNWDMITKLFIPNVGVIGSGALQGGIILWEDITDPSKRFFVNAAYRQTGNSVGNAGLYLFTDRTTFGSTISTFVVKSDIDSLPFSKVFYRLRKVGSTYYSSISLDGGTWFHIDVAGQTFAFTPAHVGIWVDNTTGAARSVYYEFVRWYSTMPDYLGGV